MVDSGRDWPLAVSVAGGKAAGLVQPADNVQQGITCYGGARQVPLPIGARGSLPATPFFRQGATDCASS